MDSEVACFPLLIKLFHIKKIPLHTTLRIIKLFLQDNVAYFSFPFEAEMYYKRPVHEEKNHGMLI